MPTCQQLARRSHWYSEITVNFRNIQGVWNIKTFKLITLFDTSWETPCKRYFKMYLVMWLYQDNLSSGLFDKCLFDTLLILKILSLKIHFKDKNLSRATSHHFEMTNYFHSFYINNIFIAWWSSGIGKTTISRQKNWRVYKGQWWKNSITWSSQGRR